MVEWAAAEGRQRLFDQGPVRIDLRRLGREELRLVGNDVERDPVA